jgi:multiple sugar transport system permease protein
MYQDAGLDWTFVATMMTVYMLPPIVMVYFFQKYLLVGMT